MYDPSVGRFISEDPHWNPDNMIYGDNPSDSLTPNISAITQSSNLYVYGMNNPINKRDPKGEAAGDWFSSPDAAAKDFGMNYNDDSIRNNAEYGSYIYSFTGISTQWIKGKKVAVVTTYYSYTAPVRGNRSSVNIDNFNKVPGNGTAVAIIHTHGRYKQDYSDEKFSGKDMTTPKSRGISIIYVVTPGGHLKKANTQTYDTKVIDSGMPYDVNSPDKAWWRRSGGVSY